MTSTTKFAGNWAKGSDGRKYFDALAGTDLQILSDYLHSLDVEGFEGRDPPTTAASAEQVVMSFNSQQKFLHDVLYNPEIIAEAKLSAMLYEDSHDHLEDEYVRSAIYDVYKRNYSGYKCSERELWRFFKKAIDGFELLKNQPRFRGRQVRMVAFPQLDVARDSFKRNLNIEKYSFL